MENKIFIGSDFEMPILATYEIPLSVEGKLGGTKQEPIDIGEGCTKQEDNVMAEFNIPAVNNVKDFKKYIHYCIEKGNEILEKYGQLRKISSAFYSKGEVSTEQGATFGCDPSFDVYSRDIVAPKKTDTNLRTAGFHLHIDCEQTEENIERIVKKLDLYLGVPSLLLDPDNERRRLYGKAGEFRFTTYGLEYRVLGSGMLKHLDFVWEGIFKALDDMESHDEKLIQKIINTGDIEAARKLYPEIKVEIYDNYAGIN